GVNGHVGVHGDNLLTACTRSKLATGRILKAVAGARVAQDGSDGQNVVFDVASLDTVAAILRLRRRKRMTAEQKAALAEASAAWRLQPRRSERFGEAPGRRDG